MDCIVGASHGDLLAVRRKRRAEDRIRSDFDGAQQFALARIPDLDFAKLRRRATTGDHQRTIGRKSDRENAFAFALHAAHQSAAIRFVKQHLAIAANG